MYGCASVQYNRSAKGPLPRLDPSGSAYVLIPANAIYYGKECIGSGKIIGNLIYSAFFKHLKRVEIAPEGEKLEDGLKKAKDSNFVYLIDSRILRWEDYVTEWNGRLDRIDMQMDILDVQTTRLIDSVNFEGNGTWFTFGGYHPQDVISKSIGNYVVSLFNLREIEK